MESEQVKTWEKLSAADLAARLAQFAGSPQEFLAELLAAQRRLAGATAGAVFRVAEGELQAVAADPRPREGQPAPAWLAQAAQAAASAIHEGATVVLPMPAPTDMYGQGATRHLIVVPIRHSFQDGVRGASAFLVPTGDPAELQAARDRLELSAPLLSLYEMQVTLQRRQLDMRRLRDSLEVLSAVNQHNRFRAACMAVCNELAGRLAAQRVSLGFLRGRGVRLIAISHTENFARRMQLVQDLEAAMEECLDQDVEVMHPPAAEATYVSRAAARLSDKHGPTGVCSFPLRHDGAVQAILTVETDRDGPLDEAGVEAVRLTANMITARLVDLHAHDRWAGAKAAAGVRRAAAAAVGPKHTWAKLLALGVLAGAVYLVFARGDFTVDAPFTLQAAQRQVVPAPFDGKLHEVKVDLGARVAAGQLLARLDTVDLELELAKARHDLAIRLKDYDRALAQAARLSEADRAMPEGQSKLAEAQMARLSAEGTRVEIQRLEYQIEQAGLRSPIDGIVVVGDLKQLRNAPVRTGDVLFEVAPVHELHAELSVDEKDAHELRLRQRGELATPGEPADRLGFLVERISPVAEVDQGHNVFKVRAQLTETRAWMKPGMGGVARVHVDRRRLAYVWTRRIINWVRLKLWI